MARVLSTSEALNAVTRGVALFRAQPASTVRREHFDPWTADSHDDCSLLAMSSRADFGSVHAFISHSYHDEAESKACIVQEWAAQKLEAPCEVLVWLDKTCIDPPSRHAESNTIGLLPVFVAGCQQMLILPGATYTSRLWCLLELFVYMQIGGSADSIVMRPLPGIDSVCLMQPSIDVAKAGCAEPDDRETILAVIETSSGSLAPFNQKMRQLFGNRQLGSTQPVAQAVGRKAL